MTLRVEPLRQHVAARHGMGVCRLNTGYACSDMRTDTKQINQLGARKPMSPVIRGIPVLAFAIPAIAAADLGCWRCSSLALHDDQRGGSHRAWYDCAVH